MEHWIIHHLRTSKHPLSSTSNLWSHVSNTREFHSQDPPKLWRDPLYIRTCSVYKSGVLLNAPQGIFLMICGMMSFRWVVFMGERKFDTMNPSACSPSFPRIGTRIRLEILVLNLSLGWYRCYVRSLWNCSRYLRVHPFGALDSCSK